MNMITTGSERQLGLRTRRGRVMRQRSSSFVSLRDLLFVLFKHKTKALVVGITLLVLAALAAVGLPSKYASHSKMLVNLGRQSGGMDATSVLGPTVIPLINREAEINSEMQILKSRAVAERAVKLLGDGYIARDPVDAVETLWNYVGVKAEPQSAVLTVSFEASRPEKAQKVVEAYVNAYLDVRAEMLANRGSTAFFQQQGAEARKRLAELDTQLRELKDATGVTDPDAQKQILLNRMATLQGALDAAQADLAASRSSIKTLEERLKITPERTQLATGEAMTALDQLRAEVNKMKLERDDLLTRYYENAPNVVMLTERLEAAQKQLDEAETGKNSLVTGLNPVHQGIQTQLESEYANRDATVARIDKLIDDKVAAESGLAKLNDSEIKIKNLAREANIAEDFLKKYAQGLDVARTDQALGGDKISNISVFSPATLDPEPSSPNRKLLMVFGLFLAFAGAIGTAFVSEAFDLRVSRPEDLKRIGLWPVVPIPVLRMARGLSSEQTDDPIDLAFKPTKMDLDASETSRPTRFVRSNARPNVTILPQRGGSASKLSPRDVLLKLGQVDEAYAEPSIGTLAPANLEVSRPALSPRMLDACQAVLERLVFSRVAAGKINMPRSIAVLSVTSGEGTTTLATHLASAMTEFIHPSSESSFVERVLLVDANVANPAAHKVLDTSPTPGVAEWLTEPGMNGRPLGDFVKPTTVPNLDLLPAGLASAGHQIGRYTDAVTLATTSNYHSIIIDLPSMDRSEASARMAGLCDAAILVVECNTANREVVRQAAQRLEECGVMLLGTVLNKRTFPIPEQLYRWF